MRFGPAIRLIPALILACFASLAMAGGGGGADGAGQARYLGSYPWVMDKPWFGGWSGIELSADGRQMTAITDRGRILRAGIDRKGAQITAITPRRAWRLAASNGNFLSKRNIDSEGLVVAPDGAIYISYEGVTRVARYAKPGAPARILRHHEAFRGFEPNKSLEALAMDRRGRLFAIPELLDRATGIRVFVLENNTWSTPFTLQGGGGFLPVGADFGPDGRFYLLERAWIVLGFRTRVRRWDMIGGQPHNEELLLQTRMGTHGNLEGLAVWRDQQGRTRLTMLADDNFLFFQRTELVEYALQE